MLRACTGSGPRPRHRHSYPAAEGTEGGAHRRRPPGRPQAPLLASSSSLGLRSSRARAAPDPRRHRPHRVRQVAVGGAGSLRTSVPTTASPARRSRWEESRGTGEAGSRGRFLVVLSPTRRPADGTGRRDHDVRRRRRARRPAGPGSSTCRVTPLAAWRGPTGVDALFLGDAMTTRNVRPGAKGPEPGALHPRPVRRRAVPRADRGINATWVLPGHGPAYDAGVGEAVRLVRKG